jgi:cysteine desulfurase
MKDRIYLDNHATTPCDVRVVETMLPYFTERFGNAASTSHSFGMEAKAAVEQARSQMASLINASPKEIVWTSGATESDNIAVIGAAIANPNRGRHVITTNIEHDAILDACDYLVKRGFDVTILQVGPNGRVTPEQVKAAIRDDTLLVSVMAANNEIGTVQPLAQIGAICRERDVLFHTDAVQALGRVPIDVVAMNIDLLSATAHKMYGPKGVGALYVRRGRPRFNVSSLIHGGGQERGMRSGTLAVPLIVGMGKAAELARTDLDTGAIDDVRRLRDTLLSAITDLDVVVNGSTEHRLPNNVNVAIPGVDASALMMSMRQVAFSSGSACATSNLTASHVILSLDLPADLHHTVVRFGVGRQNTIDEIETVATLLKEKIPAIREMTREAELPS